MTSRQRITALLILLTLVVLAPWGYNQMEQAKLRRHAFLEACFQIELAKTKLTVDEAVFQAQGQPVLALQMHMLRAQAEFQQIKDGCPGYGRGAR